MSRDPEVVRARADDPLQHDRVSPRLYFAFNEARQRVLRDARRLAVPALVMHAAADRVVDPAGSAAFAAAAPPSLVTSVVYPGGYHEIFNDLDRQRAVADLTGWIERVVTSPLAVRR